MTKRTVPTKAWIALAAGFLVLFIGGGARFAIGLTLKPMVEELGWDRTVLGVTVGVGQIFAAASVFVAGVLSDRLSLRRVLGGGVLLSGVAIGLMSLVSEPWHAIVLYGVLFAIGNGAAWVTSVGVMVTRAFPGRAGLANAVVTSGMSVGQLVMISALAAVLVTIGWRSVFVWLGVAYLIVLIVLLGAIPGEPETKPGGGGHSLGGLSLAGAARTRQFWLLLAIYAICGFGDFFVTTHAVAFAQDKGLSALFAGNLLALMGLTALVGVIAAGYWGDHSGPVWPTAASFAARVAVFALVLVDQSAVSVAAFTLVFGLTFLMTAPVIILFVRDSFGTTNLGALSGFITMVHHLAGGVGAYIGASIFDATKSYDSAFVIMLVVSALAMVLSLALRRTREAL